MSELKVLMKNGFVSPDEDLKPTFIMRNVYGMFPSIAMLSGMQLNVFTPLKDGPLDAKSLAAALSVQADKLEPLLYSLVVAGLLEVENENFSNTTEADKFLVSGRPDYIGGLSGFYNLLLTMALKTADSIRTGAPQAKFDFHTLPDEDLMAYFRKQIGSSLNAGREIAIKTDFSKFENLLDAGGGSGGVAMAICSKYQHIKATVADLPRVAKVTEHFIAEAGMSARISVSPTDLSSDSPAGKYDLAILRAFIQILSKKESQMVLNNIGKALSPGGRILIFGNILENSRLGPLASIAFDLVFLNAYDYGKAYTENEYREMLSNAGFTDITVDHDVLIDGMGLVSATKR